MALAGKAVVVNQSGFVITAVLGGMLLLLGVAMSAWRLCGMGVRVRHLQDAQFANYSRALLEAHRMQAVLVEYKGRLVTDALAHGAPLEIRGQGLLVRCGSSAVWPRAVQQNVLLCLIVVNGYEWRCVI